MTPLSARAWPRAVLLGGLVGALLCALGALLGALLSAGTEGLLGAVTSLAVTGGYLVAAVVGDSFALRTLRARSLGRLLVGFLTRAVAVVLVLGNLEASGWLAGRARVDWLAWTTVALVCGWSIGIIWTLRHARSYIYDEGSGPLTSADHQADGSTDGTAATHGGDGVMAVSYLLAGVGCYGALGWLADRLLHTSFCLPGGLVLGAAAAVYLIVKRFGGDR